LALALGSTVTLLAALLLSAAPAGAVVKTVETTTVGLQPREMARYWEGDQKWNGLGNLESEANTSAENFNNDPSHMGHPHPVMHSAATYVIYWDPQDYYHGDWQGLIDGFMANLGTAGGELGNVFAVDTQYTDETNQPATSHSSFRGAYTDTNPYPASEGCTDPHPWKFGVPLLEGGGPACLTDAQVRTQLETFISEQHSLEKGMGTIFYVLTPPGVTVCLDKGGPEGHCSDFDGTTSEISEYEEAKNSYSERLEKYEREKKAYEKEHEPGAEPPVKPEESKTPPAGYADYTKSFCSYHSDINPSGNENGSAETILYAMIPWTAGGEGDYHLSTAERTPAFDCQDGGFEPGTKPLGELQEKERTKVTHTPKEEEEFKEKSTKEKREEEEARELGLEGPHEQEPNQLGAERGPDSFWDHGLADLIINQIAVEQQNIVTDPLLNAWQDSDGNELTDECRNSFFSTSGGSASAIPLTRAGTLSNESLNGDSYYLNDAFNLASQRLPYPGVSCTHGVTLEPKFTAPNPVNSGEIVGFDGMESDVTLDSAISFSPSGAAQDNYATYTWNFGDGSPEVSGYAPGAPSQNSPASSPCVEPWLTPCAASTFHSYQYGGTYDVTLTIHDVGGNTAGVMEPITVVGPPAPGSTPASASTPAAGTGAASTAAGSAPAGSGSTSGSSGTAKPTIPGPVASAAVVSRSLPTVLKKGLVISYSVNEQVAGQFQVLLASSVAERIGLHGAPATDMPPGSVPSIVIGKAILVTTKGGRNTVKIQFGKKTAAKLRKLRSVSLTIRLVVRNASSHTPLTTTVISTVTLTR
jgi:hypothetical protein